MPYLKNSRCRNCGAPKVTRSKTAYVYCDYCACFADYDFQIAVENPIAHPGAQYQALQVALHPKMEAARLQGDEVLFMECQRELFALHADMCPASYSPRIGDPSYKERLMHYLALSAMISAFNEEAKRCNTEVDSAMRVLRWVGNKVRSDTFWRLFNAYRTHSEVVLNECDARGALRDHPDEITPEMAAPIGYSVFVQGWLPHLSPEDAEALLERTGLRGDYRELPDPATSKRHCGNCGSDLVVVDGAQCVLCEACGFLVEVAGTEVACPECGASLSVVAGGGKCSCPYCESEVRVL
jgi:uncharacterized Zn finger protein (UPF0148 family)